MPEKSKNNGKTFKRLMAYILKAYKFHLIFVAVCIFISVLANVQGTLFMQTLIDDFIVPLLKAKSPDFTDLKGEVIRVGLIYSIGVIATYTYNRIMVNVTQGTLNNLRNSLFTKMES
ncbi:MAG: ABC transporter ATP-binding protein, partial [Lachnospiraceae bacterium]|nr:ABC transporter ATP-binding protein [Lachnospiraceae bacterium]